MESELGTGDPSQLPLAGALTHGLYADAAAHPGMIRHGDRSPSDRGTRLVR